MDEETFERIFDTYKSLGFNEDTVLVKLPNTEGRKGEIRIIDVLTTARGLCTVRTKYDEARAEIDNHACMRETLRQISVQPCDPSRHDEQGSVCSPCHAKSYFEQETDHD